MEVSPYKEQLDQMTWSFSRVNAYSTCPRMFKLTYLDHAPKANSAFGEWGSLCHSVYEDFAKGIKEEDCNDELIAMIAKTVLAKRKLDDNIASL